MKIFLEGMSDNSGMPFQVFESSRNNLLSPALLM